MDDKLDKYFREQLSKREYPFKEAYWEAAQSLLQRRKRRHRLLFWLLMGAGVVAVVWWQWPNAPVGADILRSDHKNEKHAPTPPQPDSSQPNESLPGVPSENPPTADANSLRSDHKNEKRAPTPPQPDSSQPNESLPDVPSENPPTADANSLRSDHKNEKRAPTLPQPDNSQPNESLPGVPSENPPTADANSLRSDHKNEKYAPTPPQHDSSRLESELFFPSENERANGVAGDGNAATTPGYSPNGTTTSTQYLRQQNAAKLPYPAATLPLCAKQLRVLSTLELKPAWLLQNWWLEISQVFTSDNGLSLSRNGYRLGLRKDLHLKRSHYFLGSLTYEYRSGTFEASKMAVARNYRFGLELDSQFLKPKSLHYADLTLGIGWTKRRHQLECSVSGAFLAGIRGDRGYYRRVENTHPPEKEFVPAQSGWLVEDGFRRFGFAGVAAYWYRLSTSTAIGLAARYQPGGVVAKDYAPPVGNYILKESGIWTFRLSARWRF